MSRPRRLTNPAVLIGRHGPMTNGELKAAMGCDPKRHWPDQGVRMTLVQGLFVKVEPKASRISRRAVVKCPRCATWRCAGHIGQHMQGSVCK
jgi:hypothetical protein